MMMTTTTMINDDGDDDDDDDGGGDDDDDDDDNGDDDDDVDDDDDDDDDDDVQLLQVLIHNVALCNVTCFSHKKSLLPSLLRLFDRDIVSYKDYLLFNQLL